MPKFIVLNGAAGMGKTTLSQKYIDDHPLSLMIESDQIIAGIGDWLTYEDEARRMVFELIKSMIATHINNGYDVILPYLVLNTNEIREFEALAEKVGADYFEIVLLSDETDATRRLMQRGTWGEPNAPPLTEADRPVVHDLYRRFSAALKERPHAKIVTSHEGYADETYQAFLSILSS